MAERVHRVTMFKMPKEDDRAKMLEQYKVMAAENKRDGKPYILSMTVGPAEEDPRSQGYTLVSKTEFASMDDMEYYDNECPAHGQIKALVPSLTVEGILTVYFKAAATGGAEAK